MLKCVAPKTRQSGRSPLRCDRFAVAYRRLRDKNISKSSDAHLLS